MSCPSCNGELIDLEEDEIVSRSCEGCGGLLIGGEDLSRILLEKKLPDLEAQGGRVDADALTGDCPDCEVQLVRLASGNPEHPLYYDTCEFCGNVFLDSEFVDTRDSTTVLQQVIDFFKAFPTHNRIAAD